jgi:Coenzyme PQQ synthesis protein D (PqqD)
MTAAESTSDISPLTAKACVPQSVVYRSFPSETVVLNLETGQYHGLNATAGRMLEALVDAPTVAEAIEHLVVVYRQPRAIVEADIRELCGALLSRGLIEIDEHTSTL